MSETIQYMEMLGEGQHYLCPLRPYTRREKGSSVLWQRWLASHQKSTSFCSGHTVDYISQPPLQLDVSI